MNQKLRRREFLKALSMTAGALTAQAAFPAMFGSVAHANSNVRCLQIFLGGGCDWFLTHLREGSSAFMDTYRQIRPTLGLPLRDNNNTIVNRLALTGTEYTLHPRLTELQTLYTRGQLAVLMGCGVPLNNSGSHEEAQDHIRHGAADGRLHKFSAGWMNRLGLQNFSDPFNVLDRSGGSSAANGASPFKPLNILNLSSYGFSSQTTGESNFRLDTAFMLHDAQPNNQIAREFVSAFDIVQSSVDRVRQAVTGTTFSPLFPNSNIGNQLRDIFISFRNFPTRFAYVEQGGYDLHENADPQGQMLNTPMGQSRLLRDLNDALAAFRLNCEATGIWQDTIIMITTEFSRTLRENGSFGVDHADGHVCFVLGGGVRGGHYGENPTPEQLRSPRNGIDATIASPDVYIEIARKMGLRTDGLLPAGYNPRSLGLFV